MSGLLTSLLGRIGQGIKFGLTIPVKVPRAFRRAPSSGKLVAETDRAAWMPREPVAPPEWWPPEKDS